MSRLRMISGRKRTRRDAFVLSLNPYSVKSPERGETVRVYFEDGKFHSVSLPFEHVLTRQHLEILHEVYLSVLEIERAYLEEHDLLQRLDGLLAEVESARQNLDEDEGEGSSDQD